MPYTLAFEHQLDYDAGLTGITVPVSLESDGRRVDVEAKLDTGASACIFARQYGEALSIDIEQGWPSIFSTPTGQFRAYQFDLTLWVCDYQLSAWVYFAEDEAFQRNVLGRHGFLDRLNLGLVDYEGKLYLNLYDETLDA